MTELEERLRRDAARIRAETTPELRARLQASLQAADPAASAARRRRWPRLMPSPQLLGGAALAAAVAVAGVLALRPEAPEPESWPATPTAQTQTAPPASLPVALQAEFVLLELEQRATQPLTEEQERLEADLRRIEEELRRAF
ncbi:hypothetical protein [Lentisalinibacter sediminis]|uniref:hypothetical protein n=1 Tax=Lentisalinibacter sediminis TaxID=2992237 RepID=UPI0038692DF8